MRAASTRPNTSGASKSSSPTTSSLIQDVPKSSRAICAVATASFTDRQPAVFGSTRRPSERIISQKLSPARLPPASRRSDTVTTSAREAFSASARMAGDGYCAVPTSRRERNSTP